MNRQTIPILTLCAFAAARAFAAADVSPGPGQFGRVVELPPLLVTGGIQPRPWRYLEMPGLQVLSRATDAAAKDFLEEYQRCRLLLGLILPPEMQEHFSAPWVVILSGDATTSTQQQQLLVKTGVVVSPFSENADTTDTAALRASMRTAYANVRFLSNLGLEDVDAQMHYVMLSDRSSRVGPLKPLFGAVRLLMQGRTPLLPDWVRIGIEALNDLGSYEEDQIVISPTIWTSILESVGLRGDSEYPRFLLPMREILEGPAPKISEMSERAIRWRMQVALFCRWALATRDAERAAGFWRYAARMAVEPPTEEAFRECLGVGYADMRDILSDFLPHAVRTTDATARTTVRLPPIPAFRNATPSEIARISAEWTRLEIPYVRAKFPEFVPHYQDQLATLIAEAAESGERHQMFLETVALARCDAADNDGAEPLLLQAAAATLRPRIHFELARIALARAVRQSPGGKGPIRAEDARTVLGHLAAAASLAPDLPEVYTLALEILTVSDGPAFPSDLALIASGLEKYPKNTRLSLRAAALYSRDQMASEARSVLERASRLAQTTADAAAIKVMQEAIK